MGSHTRSPDPEFCNLKISGSGDFTENTPSKPSLCDHNKQVFGIKTSDSCFTMYCDAFGTLKVNQLHRKSFQNNIKRVSYKISGSGDFQSQNLRIRRFWGEKSPDPEIFQIYTKIRVVY